MADQMVVLVHDVGTTGNKSCIYRLNDTLEFVGSSLVEYPLTVLPNGGVEQRRMTGGRRFPMRPGTC
jgi:sugar (pentulose or hexulose) kinase